MFLRIEQRDVLLDAENFIEHVIDHGMLRDIELYELLYVENFIDLFSGSGGLSLGVRDYGFPVRPQRHHERRRAGR